MSDSRGLTRRRFMAGAAGGAAALGLGVPLAGCGSRAKGDRGSVVVVGAGLAGLTAAYELDRRGWDVTVVEARDRVGGRCHTFRDELEGGQVAEAGGEFVDANHKALLGYAKRFGLELDDLNELRGDEADLSDVVYVDGELHDRADVVDDAVQAEIDRYDERIARYAAVIDRNDPARTGAGLDTRPVAHLLDELDLDPDARALIEADLRAEFAVEPEEVSLLFVVVLEAAAGDVSEEDVERFRIRGGNDQLPRALAGALSAPVVLRSPVESIEPRSSGVRVVSGRQRIDADYCVIAAPLPALRSVELGVPLPRSVRRAVAALQYGHVVKTALQYDSRFWIDDGLSGDAVTDLPIQTTWDASGSGTGSALMTYGPAAAQRLAAIDPKARIQAAADQVAEVFSGAPRRPVAGATVAWHRERFSGGAYSAWAPRQYTAFWPALRRPYGRVYFAGEHTDLLASYMEGAVRSGQRVATAIEARRA